MAKNPQVTKQMSIKTLRGLMVAQVTCLGFAGVVLLTGHAAAATIKNNDPQAYQIEVITSGERKQHDLPSGKTLAEICKAGCVIRLNGSSDNDYALEGSERVSIEGGLVYYDGEEVAPKGEVSGAQSE